MPKSKTHKGLLKRVRVSSKGKVKWKRSGTSHLNSHMTGKQIREHRKQRIAQAADIGRLSTLLNRRLTPGTDR